VAGALTWQYWQPKKMPTVTETYTPAIVDVQPGGNKATLTLSTGTVIDLAKAGSGKLAQEGNVNVVKQKEGEIRYERTGDGDLQQGVSWNTLSTPRGGQYSLVLPDGSKVWLNAASSIKYPAQFSANERRVSITGEAYFDVVSLGRNSKKLPFVVTVQSTAGTGVAQIEVLGTSFNIMAYDDETAVKTTLLNGKVKISALQSPAGEGNAFKLLAPGQQAQIPHTTLAGKDPIKVIDLEDAKDILGWKNGLVSLQNADIRTIMRMISRWYNIEVEYQGQAPDYTFTGTLPLKENLSAVIKVLEFGGVRFKMQQNKIIILP
jgi:ferric-dicitrate binding protein FerR (iron transport regulator)